MEELADVGILPLLVLLLTNATLILVIPLMDVLHHNTIVMELLNALVETLAQWDAVVGELVLFLNHVLVLECVHVIKD
jgi:hypothetical protein